MMGVSTTKGHQMTTTTGLTCTWLRELTAAEIPDGWYPDFPSDLIVECGAPMRFAADGRSWECDAGHSHDFDAEYYDADDLAGTRNAGALPSANARHMSTGEVIL